MKKEEKNNTQVIIEPPKGLFNFNLRELITYRELLLFLVWRDIRVRYRQTILGAIWAILQPLLTMVVFSIIFGSFAKLPSQGIPYPIFTYSGLLPWQLFSTSLSSSSESVVNENRLVSKIYFPRLIIPLSSVGAGLVDFLLSFVIFIVLMIFYSIPFSWKMLLLPLFILFALLSALSVGLWLSALNVQYRDVRYTVPFLVTAWMYLTPVAYSATIVPERWRALYGLNPMVGVVEGFRWVLLDTPFPDIHMFIVSIVMVLILLASGLVYFKHMENYFADVI
jgi:lipopolysaccharide transport system permease protein